MDEYLDFGELESEADGFNKFHNRMTVRLQKRAGILADKMIRQARNERDNARQKAKRLQHKLAVLGIT